MTIEEMIEQITDLKNPDYILSHDEIDCIIAKLRAAEDMRKAVTASEDEFEIDESSLLAACIDYDEAGK